MFPSRPDPYRTDKQASKDVEIRSGFVRSYNPDRRLHTVDIELKGETLCKQASSGILKPYSVGDRVVVSKFVGSDWTILSGLPVPGAPPETVADSEEETLARGRGRLTSVSTNYDNREFSYRGIDTAGEAEPPVFEGEVLIENKTDRVSTRSFLRIFRFGDILFNSSKFCYIHLNKLRSSIITKCRNLYMFAAGWRKQAETPSKGPHKDLTTVTETFKVDPRSKSHDMMIVTGNIPNGRITKGTETTFPNGFIHYDIDNGVYRIMSDGSWLVLGNQNGQASGSGVEQPYSVDANGISLQTAYGYIQVLNEGSIKVSTLDGDSQVEVSNETVSLKKGEQSVLIDGEGVNIFAKNFNVTATGSTNINSTGNVTMSGPVINLN